MVIVDADEMMRLDAAEKDAQGRYHEVLARGDRHAALAAANAWTSAYRAAQQYALTGVERYDDFT
jgi:hypothetical protein